MADTPTAFAVQCYTCHHMVYEGNDRPADGQTLLSAYADSQAGPACPSGVTNCPNKTSAVNVSKQQSTAALAARIAALEAKVRP